MSQLTDLPTELLTKIVRHTDTLYEKETGLDIFNIMRVNQKLCDIAITVHLKVKDFDRSEMMTKMLEHEQCYVNHARQTDLVANAFCKMMITDCDDWEPLPTCPAGHSQFDRSFGPFVLCRGWQPEPPRTTFEDALKVLEGTIREIESEEKKEKRERNKKRRARRL